jgi:glycosyltransferase involved in cell wall biosynthesis
MFIQAIGAANREIDVLNYVGPTEDISEASVRALERAIGDLSGAAVTIFSAPRMASAAEPGRFSDYLAGLTDFRKLSKRFHHYYMTSGAEPLSAFEACLSRKPSFIFAHRLAAMCPILETSCPLPPVIFDLDDVEHRSFLSQITKPPHWRGKKLCYLQIPSLMLGERRAIKLAARTFVCSDVDQRALQRLYRTGRIDVVPNSVAIPPDSDTGDDEENLVTFVGELAYPPNVDAVEFFINHVWPLVLRENPKARFIVAGRHREMAPSYHRKVPGVSFTGFVDTLTQIYRNTAVICCPIRSGGGTRIKIIEAAAHSKAILATTFGASGLSFENGRHLLLRDTAEALAQGCIALLNDRQLRRRLGNAARDFVIECYDREHVISRVRDVLCEVERNGADQ